MVSSNSLTLRKITLESSSSTVCPYFELTMWNLDALSRILSWLFFYNIFVTSIKGTTDSF